ncbi:hypothetical protein FRC12_019421 [Ceratobasidium sp. 428]|nr:hypothetical protein FRC12_019421 [Ceratobasidium sp. 428]
MPQLSESAPDSAATAIYQSNVKYLKRPISPPTKIASIPHRANPIKLATLGVICVAFSAFQVFGKTREIPQPRSTPGVSPYGATQAEWNALNITLGGRLGRGVPFARECFTDVGPDVQSGGASCASVQANYTLDTFRATQFGAAMKTQWETCQKTNQGCLLDSSNPTNSSAFLPPKVCYQGSVAPYYIDVQGPLDVIKAFAFSASTGVPLSIKNSGHDFIGRSMMPGTLALWTHHLQYINYSTSFVPDGCNSVPGIPAFTYGAGQDMESLIDHAYKFNVTFIGGSAKTVGAAGGWVQGGGHSSLSNDYGLGVDRVRQFRIVTPDGVPRVANECQNTDLFWALRGGGGGTFGVVLEVTSEVVPNPVSTVSLRWQLTLNANISEFMNILIQNSVQWSKDGWGGYVYPTASILANPRLNATEAARSLAPLTDFLQTGAGTSTWSNFSSFSELFAEILTFPDPAGVNNALSSRLISDTLFTPETAPALLSAALEVINSSNGTTGFYFTTPYSYSGRFNQTSVSPAWRGAVWHVISSVKWAWDASSDVAAAKYAAVHNAIEPLRALTPGGGAYQNEADVYEPDASTSFWGSNYAGLVEVKKKYDPKGLLDCWNCVGWKGDKTPEASCYLDYPSQ